LVIYPGSYRDARSAKHKIERNQLGMLGLPEKSCESFGAWYSKCARRWSGRPIDSDVCSDNHEMNFDSDKHFGLVDIANGELKGGGYIG